jgi:hypothetical protein
MIKQHENCIEILEGILTVKRQIQVLKESINAYNNFLPDLARKYERRIIIKKMAIGRLNERYKKLVNEIYSSLGR